MTELITIQLTPEQIEQLKPLFDELRAAVEESGERRMFAGQVITRKDDFDSVVFGLIPPDQSLEIERIRGFD